jgi:HSP20 family molecular chaperone IbpA
MTPQVLQRLHFTGFSVDDILWAGQAPPLRPQLEIVDEGEAYSLRVVLGGLRPEDLELRVGPDFLEIEGHQVELAPRFWRLCFAEVPPRELHFARRFPLASANPLRARARVRGEHLELRVPKAKLLAPAPETVRSVPIERAVA